MVIRHHPLANCEECPLYTVGKYVPSSGPEKASLAIVGEVPGKQEVRSGKQFVGPTGQLMNIILEHNGIERDECLLTNACSCRPPDAGPPPKAAILACRPRLLEEIGQREATTVIAFGNAATESTLGKSGVTNLRVGPGRFGSLLPGVRIIPTINPAAALRQADQFPNIVADVGKVHYEASEWNTPEYVVADTELDALELLELVDARVAENSEPGEGVLVVDIEVDIEKDTSFDIPAKYGMLCVGIGYAEGRVLVLSEGVMDKESVRDSLGHLLRKYRVVAQNGKFDLKGLYPILGPIELWFDTMLASYVFDERPGVHGLKYMAVEYLGAPQYDEEIKRYVGPGVGYGAIPRDLLYKYNAYDVSCTYSLWRMFEAKFGNDPTGDLRRVHDHLVQASNGLMFVELNGISIDDAYLSELNVQYIDSLHKIEDEMNEVIGSVNYDKRGGINPRSPKQVQAYLADKNIDTGSTDVDHLELILKRKSLPKDEEEVKAFIEVLLRHRTESKTHGTYIKGIKKRMYRGRVYPTFMLHGTTTGRLSCRNPNLQNIPRDSNIRRMFVPSKPENRFLQVDYSQAELRVLSFLARDVYFRDIFNAGDRDLFDDLSEILYPGKTKAGVGAAAWKELRIRVKAFVYGLGYGREAGSIAQEFNIPMSEAMAMKNTFFSTIPEIVAFQDATKEAVLDGKDLVTPWGRHRRFNLITDENRHEVLNEALAFLPQSTASDMCLQAMYWTRKEIRGLGYIRNIVHDSLLVEGHKDDMEELQEIVERNMIKSAETIIGDYVKFAVESKIGTDWGQV